MIKFHSVKIRGTNVQIDIIKVYHTIIAITAEFEMIICTLADEGKTKTYILFCSFARKN
jgi:hypothetical protein